MITAPQNSAKTTHTTSRRGEIIFAAVTGLVQLLKKYSSNEYITIFMTVGISVVAAGIYVALQAANFWQTALEILTISGAIYTFIIARFESNTSEFPNG